MNALFDISISELINEALLIQSNLHFIRSDWFYAFIPLLLFLYFSFRVRSNNRIWSGIVDQKLMPYVLSVSGGKQRRYPLLLVFIASSLGITALAGPVVEKQSQPVYRELSSLVVLLDLSQSMNAADIKPSRLARARLELLDLLKTRKTGQTALIVYAADAFVVTPLTDDNATIANMVPSLTTDMMPAQGSNLSSALARAYSLLTQAGIVNGNILVITDEIRQSDEAAIKKIFAQGHRLSILGIGTTTGAPIPLDGAFLQDNQGAIVIPKLSPLQLQRYALSGGGLYSSLHADDSDINKLNQLFQSSDVAKDNKRNDQHADIWIEEGHWLLLPLLLLAALWARKGWLAIQLLFVFTLSAPMTPPAYADDTDTLEIVDFDNLWSRPDQKAMQAFDRGEHEKAANTFTNPEWKASALYRKGEYQAAAEILEHSNNSSGLYNRGNALARLGKLEEAIKSYDQALALDENNKDAKHNREQVKQALEKQQEEQQDGQQDGQQEGEQEDDQKENDQQQGEQQSEQQSQDQQSQDAENSDNKSSEQAENNDGEAQQNQSENEQLKNKQLEQEQQQLKQRDAKAEAEQQEREQQQHQEDEKQQQENMDDKQPSSDEENQQGEQQAEDKESNDKPIEIEINPTEASITEEEKATQQWLKRIPDDPGGLLRRKFHYQYQRIPNQADSEQPW